MSYIVVYQREDGSSGVEECADLDLAVVTAERLRNVDAVERPRIFQTSEITYDFKPYYRVEVTSNASASAEVPPPPSAAPVVAAASARSEKAASPTSASVPASEQPATAEESTSDEPAEEPAANNADDAKVTQSDTPTVTSRSGLFGATVDADSAAAFPEVEQVEEETDAVPSRRGLFGR